MKTQFQKMVKAHAQYEKEKARLEFMLLGKVHFEFKVDHMPGDGWVLLEVESALVCSLGVVMDMVHNTGEFTVEDFDGYSFG